MKLPLAVATTAVLILAASGVAASEFDLGDGQANDLVVARTNPEVVAAYRSELLASADGALKEGLLKRFASIGLSIDEQAARIRQLVDAGSLSPRNLAAIPAFDVR